MALHKLKLDESGIWLDGTLLQGIKSYDIRYNADAGINELILYMDTISYNIGDESLNENEKK